MITAGTSPYLDIDWGQNKDCMTLQRWDGKSWMDFKVDGEVVKSPCRSESGFPRLLLFQGQELTKSMILRVRFSGVNSAKVGFRDYQPGKYKFACF